MLTIVVGAVFFERAFDQGIDSIWYRINKGVRLFLFRAHHWRSLIFLLLSPIYRSCGRISSMNMKMNQMESS
jgi:hypothetical protein